MIIKKSSILATSRLNIGYNLADFGSSFPYPISKISTLKVTGYFIKNKDNDIESKLKIKGEILLRDSFDDSIFSYPLNIEEEFLLFTQEDGIKEGYIIENDDFSLNDLVIRIIVSSLPSRVINPNKKVEKKDSQTESLDKNETPYNPAFDKLKDFNF